MIEGEACLARDRRAARLSFVPHHAVVVVVLTLDACRPRVPVPERLAKVILVLLMLLMMVLEVLGRGLGGGGEMQVAHERLELRVALRVKVHELLWRRKSESAWVPTKMIRRSRREEKPEGDREGETEGRRRTCKYRMYSTLLARMMPLFGLLAAVAAAAC